MNRFSLSFILFLFKLSYGPKFWWNLQNNNNILYKLATQPEHPASKLKKNMNRNLKFQVTCQDNGVYPKFTHWKNGGSNTMKYKSKFYHCILLDEIIKNHCLILSLKKEFATSMDTLSSATKFFKQLVLTISINRSIFKEEKTTVRCL